MQITNKIYVALLIVIWLHLNIEVIFSLNINIVLYKSIFYINIKKNYKILYYIQY